MYQIGIAPTKTPVSVGNNCNDPMVIKHHLIINK